MFQSEVCTIKNKVEMAARMRPR